MLERDRVLAALRFERPDIIPVEFHPSGAGMYEHGERLRDLMREHGHDFGDAADFPLAQPEPGTVDAQGRYEALHRDAWGALWRCLIFGVAGHPVERPLDDWANWPRWHVPASPTFSGPGPDFDAACRAAAAHRARYFLKGGWASVFEVMHAVRRFEDVLMDIQCDTPEIHRLADAITGHREQEIRWLLARGTDAIQLADDFGTQDALMLSRETWRRFFRPRTERLIAPARAAGVPVFYHCCGHAPELLDDLAEMGVGAIWPQLTAYDEPELARRCRDLRLAVAVHPDRSHLMTHGTPAEVRATVLRLAETFRMDEGGAWFYIEIDNGFPFENVRALIETVAELRRVTG
jgi:hypothetical protein